MPISRIDPPEGLLGVVRATLDQLLPQSPGSPGAGGGQSLAGGVGVGRSIPLYHLGLDAIAAGTGLSAARENGWRTDVLEGTRTVAVADADATGAEVRQVSRGPLVAGLTTAAAGAEIAAADAEYEERVLQAPGLSLTAVWLHRADGGGDVLLPADPAPPSVEPARAYPADELLALVAPLARERLADDPTRARP